MSYDRNQRYVRSSSVASGSSSTLAVDPTKFKFAVVIDDGRGTTNETKLLRNGEVYPILVDMAAGTKFSHSGARGRTITQEYASRTLLLAGVKGRSRSGMISGNAKPYPWHVDRFEIRSFSQLTAAQKAEAVSRLGTVVIG